MEAERATLEPPRAPSMLAVGTIVWLASELMFFGGLFAAYFTLRSEAGRWPPSGVELEITISAIATLVLIASSGSLHLAIVALHRGDRIALQRWITITLSLGALFLANQVREFFSLTFGVSSSSYGSIYYTMTGFHGLHVLAGLILLIITLALIPKSNGPKSNGPKSNGPKSNGPKSNGGAGGLTRSAPAVEAVGYYWHFVDVVWIGLFLTIFVLK